MKPANKWNKPKPDLFTLLGLLLLGLVLSYVVQEQVKEMIVMPIMDAFLWLYVLVDTVPQILTWIFFLVLGTIYVMKEVILSFSEISFRRRRIRKTRPADYLNGHINLVDGGDNRYTKQRFARYLAGLYFEISGDPPRHHRQMLARLDDSEGELPAEVMEVFKFGLQRDERLFQKNWKLWAFLRGASFAERDPDCPTEDKFEQTLCFLEQQLFIDLT